MSGRSASSVRELLGKFEENSQRISPPSRGRSPTGSESVTSTDSRPFSKVRTSFVSVERSGQMAPSLRKSSNNFEGHLGGDGNVDVETGMDGGGSEKPMANGSAALPHSAKESADPLAKVKEEDAPSGPREPNVTHDEAAEGTECSNTVAVHSNRLVSKADDDTAALLTSDPKEEKAVSEEKAVYEEEKAVSDGGALVQRRASLGDLLKGHAFEQETDVMPESAKSETSKAQESVNPGTLSSDPEIHSTHLKVNGAQPTEASRTSTTSTTNAKATSARPSAIVTKKDAPVAFSTSTAPSSEITSRPPKTPKTPQDVSTSTKQPVSKTRQTASAKPMDKSSANKPNQAPTQRSSRPSAVPKTFTTTASKAGQASTTTNPNPTKKKGPASPPTKTHPKSPTRAVRLPASLTAPTAASVAKLGGTATARPPSRTSHMTANNPPTLKNKDRTPAAASQPRPKPPRSSLPAPSAAAPNTKARTSMAGSKPADGGFLARMMRPTQSSASKTHEKAEPKTPPKKTVAMTSHKASEGAVEPGAHENGEGNSVPPQDALEPSHVPNSDTAQEDANVEADARSVAVPEALGTEGEEQGVNGNGATPSEAVSA